LARARLHIVVESMCEKENEGDPFRGHPHL